MLVGKYLRTYPHLRTRLYRQLHHSLYLDLNLDLDLDLNPSLYRALFAKTYESSLRQLLAASFRSMFVAKKLDINFNLYLNLAAAKLRGRHRRGHAGKGE